MSENQTAQIKNRSKKSIRLTALVLVLMLVSGYLAFQFLSARNYAIQTNLIMDSLYRERVGSQFAPPVKEDFWDNLVEMEKAKAFNNARMKMAQSDTVRLVIHLPDSTLRLEIKGLTVHTAKILDLRVSPSLSKIPPLVKVWFFSVPFKTTGYYSAIPHEPIVIKHAPADTIEAQNSPVLPPEPDDRNVYFTYKTGRNMVIHFNQSENGKRKAYLWQKISRDLAYFKESLGYMIRFRYRPFQHKVEITIDKQDARTIYRALPEYPLIAIKPAE